MIGVCLAIVQRPLRRRQAHPSTQRLWPCSGSRGIRVVGLLPALFIELPALTFLLRSNYWASVRVCFLAAGGALVDALLMSVTFTGFEPWGAIGGASIGTMQGLICYGHKPRSNDPPTF
jgi:hypothetical protein